METQFIEPRRFRDALGHYASGITIVGGLVDSAPVGFTCQSFYSVSIEPPLVSFSVMKTSRSWPQLRPNEYFTINLLSATQRELSEAFARSQGDRWASVKWEASPLGGPWIDGALLSLDCSVHAEHEAGDHWIVVCRVHDIREIVHPDEPRPLIYYRGRYRQLAEI